MNEKNNQRVIPFLTGKLLDIENIYEASLPALELEDTLLKLQEYDSSLLFLDIFVIDYQAVPSKQKKIDKRFELLIIILCPGDGRLIRLRTPLDSGEELPALFLKRTGYDFHEREVNEMFGICFSNIDSEKLFLPDGFKMYPMRKDFVWDGDWETAENHPKRTPDWVDLMELPSEGKGGFSLWVRHRGMRIMEAETSFGLSYRGTEKYLENTSLDIALPVFEKINQYTPIVGNFLWCHSIEALYRTEIPERAKFLRMLFLELERIRTHLFQIFNLSKALSQEMFIDPIPNLAVAIDHLLSVASGRMVSHQFSVLGGVRIDLPAGWVYECFQFFENLVNQMQDFMAKISNNSFWRTRLHNLGTISEQQVINAAVSGIVARASGFNADLRKKRPFYCYPDLSFDVPLGINGNAWDRFMVICLEILESAKICEQLLDNLPSGPLIERFELKPVSGEVMVSVEAPFGAMSIFLKCVDDVRPIRARINVPSVAIAKLFPELLVGMDIRDVYVLIKTLPFSAFELDR